MASLGITSPIFSGSDAHVLPCSIGGGFIASGQGVVAALHRLIALGFESPHDVFEATSHSNGLPLNRDRHVNRFARELTMLNWPIESTEANTSICCVRSPVWW